MIEIKKIRFHWKIFVVQSIWSTIVILCQRKWTIQSGQLIGNSKSEIFEIDHSSHYPRSKTFFWFNYFLQEQPCMFIVFRVRWVHTLIDQ